MTLNVSEDTQTGRGVDCNALTKLPFYFEIRVIDWSLLENIVLNCPPEKMYVSVSPCPDR